MPRKFLHELAMTASRDEVAVALCEAYGEALTAWHLKNRMDPLTTAQHLRGELLSRADGGFLEDDTLLGVVDDLISARLSSPYREKRWLRCIEDELLALVRVSRPLRARAAARLLGAWCFPDDMSLECIHPLRAASLRVHFNRTSHPEMSPQPIPSSPSASPSQILLVSLHLFGLLAPRCSSTLGLPFRLQLAAVAQYRSDQALLSVVRLGSRLMQGLVRGKGVKKAKAACAAMDGDAGPEKEGRCVDRTEQREDEVEAQDEERQDEEAEVFLSAQMLALESMTGDGRGRGPPEAKARRCLRATILARPALLARCLRLLTTRKSALYGKAFDALSIVAEAVRRQAPETYVAEAKPALLGLLAEFVLAPAEAVDPRVVKAFSPLLASLTPEDVAAHVQVPLERMLKKCPETFAPIAAALVSEMLCDLSGLLAAVAPIVVRILRTGHTGARRAGLVFFRRCGERCLNAVGPVAAVDAVRDALEGKSGGALTQWEQRHVMLLALRCLVIGARGVEDPGTVATVAVQALTPMLDKETHEETKMALMVTFGEWVAVAGGAAAVPKKLLKLTSKALSSPGPKSSAVPFLLGLCAAIDDPASALSTPSPRSPSSSFATQQITDLGDLPAQLEGLLSTAAKKPHVPQAEALLALFVLLRASPQCAYLSSSAVTEALATPNSWLFHPQLFLTSARDRGTEPDDSIQGGSLHLVFLCRALSLAAQIPALIDALMPPGGDPGSCTAAFGQGEGEGGATRARARCVVPPRGVVRDEALRAAAVVAYASPRAVPGLCAALWCLVVDTHGFNAMHRVATRDDEPPRAMNPIPPSYLRKALDALVPAVAPSSALAHVGLLAHHPLLAGSRRHAAALWARYGRSFLADHVVAELASGESPVRARAVAVLCAAFVDDEDCDGDGKALAPLAQELGGEGGVARRGRREEGGAFQATRRMLHSLAGDGDLVKLVEGPGGVLEMLIGGLAKDLEEVQALTDHQLLILRTPGGVLASAVQAAEGPRNDAAGDAGSGIGHAVSGKLHTIRVTKAAGRRGRGDFGAEADDLAWEEQVRAELEAKKKAAAAATAAATPSPSSPPPPPPPPALKAKSAASSSGSGKGSSKKGTGRPEFELDLGDDKKKKGKKGGSGATGGKKAAAASGASAPSGAKGASGGVKEATAGGAAATVGAPQEPLDEVSRQLQYEAGVRRQVRALVRRVNHNLAGLREVVRAAPGLGHDMIPRVMPLLARGLQLPLTHAAALRALAALTECADERLEPIAVPLSLAVRAALVHASTGPDALLAFQGIMAEVLEDIAFLCVDDMDAAPLPGEALHAVFPVLDCSLGASAPMPHADKALAVLAAHAHVISDDASPARSLRREALEAVLRVVGPKAKMAAGRRGTAVTPEAALASLCRAGGLTVGEWSVILGDMGFLGPATARLACAGAVLAMAQETRDGLLGNPLVETRLWLARHDPDEAVAAVGQQVWDLRAAPLSGLFAPPLLALLSHASQEVRLAAARALAGGVRQHPCALTAVLGRLQDMYTEHMPPRGEDKEHLSVDEYFAASLQAHEDGAEAEVAHLQRAEFRRAVAVVLRELGAVGLGATAAAAAEDAAEDAAEGGPMGVGELLAFIASAGLADPDAGVRGAMLEAGQAVIDAGGSDAAGATLGTLERFMDTSPEGEDPILGDRRKEGLVVLLGTVAKHLDKADVKVGVIVKRLVMALSTPSESVQRCVADALAPLVAAVKATAGDFLDDLMRQCVHGETYGDRRGGAYGVAALVKGLGIAALKQRNVIASLESACASGSPQNKQGALFAFECLCVRLRLLFEPYVVVILPLLLKSFSDGSDHVRSAADGASRAMMGNLSQHGVKMILPKILDALDDPAWRTKQAAIQLLGAMAYCAPRQLGQCLPQIVPQLTHAFSDTHPKVRESGKKALKDVRSVIRNPEISGLSGTLLAALTEPSKHTKAAIEALLVCEFVHSIDAPSLALLVPVLQRGMKDRSADTKRKASLITGNMCSMISDAKDMLPYLPVLLPGLKETVLDPIPDVRGTAAKALGQMVQGIGEANLDELLPWLLETLKDAPGSVERSGAAQGLAEVMAAMPEARMAEILEDTMPLYTHPNVGVREGVLWLLSFLPLALGHAFAAMIEKALPLVLAGLSDEVESVRDVAMRAGQVLVSTHGKTHLRLILSALEGGLFDDNWRIRQSSVQLLGDLLYLIGHTKIDAGPGGGGWGMGHAGGMGGTGHEDEEEEEEENDDDNDDRTQGDARAAASMAQALGREKTNSVLAKLYMLRSDTSSVVRHSTLQVWKALVPNTPRTLREILSVVMAQILEALSAENIDKRTVASRALGDVVKKLGERVLPEMVPFLERRLVEGDEHTREGVCLGLAEVLDCATPRQIEDFVASLVATVQRALSDESPAVREQAAAAFLSLNRKVGGRAGELVVPNLLSQLRSEATHATAVLGLCEVVKLRGRDFLPAVVSPLLRPPLTTNNVRALTAVISTSRNAVHHVAGKLVPVLVKELVRSDGLAREGDAEGEALRAALDECAARATHAIPGDGLGWFLGEVVPQVGEDFPAHRRWGLRLLEHLFRENKAEEMREHLPRLIRLVFGRCTEADKPLLEGVRDTVQALLKGRPPMEMVAHIAVVRESVMAAVGEAQRRRVPKGIDPLLAYYQHALQNGTSAQREVAASGLGDIAVLSDPASLKPCLPKITGPLIRILGDKFPSNVKAAVLQTLMSLLEKGGAALKTFVPQLQPTFVKALNDPAKAVRDLGVAGLGQVVQLSPRVDPLVTDLTKQINGELSVAAKAAAAADPSSVADELDLLRALLQALGGVFRTAGAKVSPVPKDNAVSALVRLLEHENDAVREIAGETLGLVSAELDEGAVAALVEGCLVQALPPDAWKRCHGACVACGSVARRGGPVVRPFLPLMLDFLVPQLQHLKVQVQTSSLEGFAHILRTAKRLDAVDAVVPLVRGALPTLADTARHHAADIRVLGVLGLKCAAKTCPEVVRDSIGAVVPALVAAVKDTNIRVKMAGERALLHSLEIHHRAETLDEFMATADAGSSRFVRDYSRRVLARLPAESDEEL